MHVDMAYLNAKLQEPIYMCQLPGYTQGISGQVLLLKKWLYGLKQLGQEWYKCLVKTLSSIGFKKPSSDAAVFRWGKQGYAISAVAVVDSAITAPDEAIIFGIKRDLKRIFQMKDLGEIH